MPGSLPEAQIFRSSATAVREPGVVWFILEVSHPSVQEEGTLSRNLERKSLISNPLESKTWFIALSDGMVIGLA
jgi:hypothetical protein